MFLFNRSGGVISVSLNLTLRRKGLLLISVLLLFELAFVGTLVVLLNQAEEESRREEHAKHIREKTEIMAQSVAQLGDDITKYVMTRDKSWLARFDHNVEEFNSRTVGEADCAN